jgi:hypothetical protein
MEKSILATPENVANLCITDVRGQNNVGTYHWLCVVVAEIRGEFVSPCEHSLTSLLHLELPGQPLVSGQTRHVLRGHPALLERLARVHRLHGRTSVADVCDFHSALSHSSFCTVSKLLHIKVSTNCHHDCRRLTCMQPDAPCPARSSCASGTPGSCPPPA